MTRKHMNTSEQAIEFLSEVATAVHSALTDEDPASANSIKTAIIMVGNVLETEMQLSDKMADVFVQSMREGELQEEDALRLLAIWKKMRKPFDD